MSETGQSLYQPMLMIGKQNYFDIKVDSKLDKSMSTLIKKIEDMENEEEDEDIILNADSSDLLTEESHLTKELKGVQAQIDIEMTKSKKLEAKIGNLKKTKESVSEKLKNSQIRIKHFRMLRDRLLNYIYDEIEKHGIDPISKEDRDQIIQQLEDNKESEILNDIVNHF